MGQWLSLPMIIGGIGLLIWTYRRGRAIPSESAKLS
jgi:phosphatidylglycerol---prolipoprotein diacylglyceryl transferase